tara:strand:- start:2935 stop:3120 length:186 start_codon:yes stop_codon:yes gene_type:complete
MIEINPSKTTIKIDIFETAVEIRIKEKDIYKKNILIEFKDKKKFITIINYVKIVISIILRK